MDARGEQGAWRAALLALVWHADPMRGRLPDMEAIRRLVPESTGARSAAVLACGHAERAAWLAFDAASYSAWLTLHRELAQSEQDPRWIVASCLFDTLGADSPARHEDAARAESAATAAQLAETAVEAAVVRAWMALERGDIDEATRVGRRAFRMARTEELPQQQYLAGLVLARLRRHAESPHLAVRILAALARAAPVNWLGAIRWELFLSAGGAELASHPSAEPHAIDAVIDALMAALRAAESGDRAAFEHEIGIADALVPTSAVGRDVATLRALVDPKASPGSIPGAMSEVVAAWTSGLAARAPSGLIGVRAGASGHDEPLEACVAVAPGTAARRILGPGFGLAGPLLRTTRPGRLETAVSVLALAGAPGVTREVLWETTYGFPFDAPIHAAALEALVHRVREMLGDAAVLDRRDAVFVLDPQNPLRRPGPTLHSLPRRRAPARARARGQGLGEGRRRLSRDPAPHRSAPAQAPRRRGRLHRREARSQRRVPRRGHDVLRADAAAARLTAHGVERAKERTSASSARSAPMSVPSVAAPRSGDPGAS